MPNQRTYEGQKSMQVYLPPQMIWDMKQVAAKREMTLRDLVMEIFQATIDKNKD